MRTVNPDMVGLMLEALEPVSTSRRERTAHENELVAQAQLEDLLDVLHGVGWLSHGNGRWADVPKFIE